MTNAKWDSKEILFDSIYMTSGALTFGFALRSFLVPAHFLDGGVTGLSLLLHELNRWNIAIVLITANLPFILIGTKIVGKGFAVRSFAGAVLLALCIKFFPYPELHYDKLITCIFGGFFLGAGIGLGMRGGCALDGIEILALFTLRRTGFTITEIILALNVIIFLFAAFYLGFETSLYSCLTYYVVTRTINYVIEGLEEFSGITIISSKSTEIKEKLVMGLGRGITIYKGERGYMKEDFHQKHDTDIVFTVVKRLEVRRLKNIVTNIDPHAFIFTNTIKETAGGILKRNIKH